MSSSWVRIHLSRQDFIIDNLRVEEEIPEAAVRRERRLLQQMKEIDPEDEDPTGGRRGDR
ncbi:MAG: hypothetical protein MZV63_52060 [Marinilabiliales bacterium]|nr:hypothetical protein [Marinilabiliales bacterium]